MSDSYDYLDTDDLPGLVGSTTPTPPLVISESRDIVSVGDTAEVLLDDLNLTRSTLRQQQEIMLQVAKEFAKTAMTAEHPKVIEALGTFMGHLTQNAKALVDMHKAAKEVTGQTPATPVQANQINAENVFFGTPNDLLDKFGTRQDSKKSMTYDQDDDRAVE